MQKIGWILVNGRNTGSSRLLGFNVHDWLIKNNIDSRIISSPNEYNPVLSKITIDSDYDIIVFQKVFAGFAPELADYCKRNSIKTAYIIDDIYQEIIPFLNKCDINIVSSGAWVMAQWVKDKCGTEPLMMWESYETPKEFYKTNYFTNKIRVVFFGTMNHLPEAWAIKSLCDKLGYDFVTISKGPLATKEWSLETIWTDLLNADIIVMPYLKDMPIEEEAKGCNRLFQAMALAIPVIASPYPAYISVVHHGRNAFITWNNTLEEWEKYLILLKDVEWRKRIGIAGRELVKDEYHIDTQGPKWLKLFNDLRNKEDKNVKE